MVNFSKFILLVLSISALEISQDFKFSGMLTLANYLDDDSMYQSVLDHGCWCSKLDFNNIDQNLLGGPKVVDDLDQICKKWFHVRNCNDKKEGGACLNSSTATYELSINNDSSINCNSNLGPCSQSSCEIDVYFSELILQHFMNNQNFLIQKVTDNSICESVSSANSLNPSSSSTVNSDINACQGIETFFKSSDLGEIVNDIPATINDRQSDLSQLVVDITDELDGHNGSRVLFSYFEYLNKKIGNSSIEKDHSTLTK